MKNGHNHAICQGLQPLNLLLPTDARLRRRTQVLVERVIATLTPLQRDFVELISWKISKYHRQDYYRFLAVAWALVFLGKLVPTDTDLTSVDRAHLRRALHLFALENRGDYKAFLASVFTTDYDLFLFCVIFKYALFSREQRFHSLVPHWENYRRMIGYAYLVLLNVMGLPKIEGIFQDTYFKAFYPAEYAEMVRRTRHLAGGMRSHFFTVNVVNELATMMATVRAYGVMHVRFKSYFSIYNKIIRKGLEHVLDVIGLRIIFPSLRALRTFAAYFEKHIFVMEKRDYVAHPKPNGYRSLHYKFFYKHMEVSSYVELQLRTRAMDEEIERGDALSGLAYALRQKKYHPKFREIHEGLAEMVRLLSLAPIPSAQETR